MCGCDGGAVVVVERVCVAVMVVRWLWWRGVCSCDGGAVVVVERVCMAAMVAGGCRVNPAAV